MDLQDLMNRGTDEEGHQLRKPLLEHFSDLLRYVKLAFYGLFVCCGVTYYFAKDLVMWLKEPMERAALAAFPDPVHRPEVIITRPFEEVWSYVQLAMYLGAFLALPWVVYQLAKFIGPGLKKSERRQIRTLTLSVYVVFLVGVYLSYRYVLEIVLHAVMTFGGGLQSLKWTLSSYISTAVGIVLAFGVLLELPVVMVYLSRWGWVAPKSWIKGWKISIFVNAVVSGFLSPPDLLSMFAMMVPMQLLYILGVMLSYLFTKREKAAKVEVL